MILTSIDKSNCGRQVSVEAVMTFREETSILAVFQDFTGQLGGLAGSVSSHCGMAKGVPVFARKCVALQVSATEGAVVARALALVHVFRNLIIN